jgi:mannose-6-phosphate isomerase
LSATLLATHQVEKPWGRHTLWPGFPDPKPDADPVGEVWFQAPGDSTPDLLIKYLFTSEKLSVQVHPNDEQAHARGLPRGKDECWVVLSAEPNSTIAIGTLRPVSHEELRAAALDGSIEGLLDWKPVKAGDFFYAPSGTVHAIGPGVTIIETQQNSETTYRLYDYGRPRELHLDDGIAVADARPYVPAPMPGEVAPGRTILVEGPKFVLERWDGRARDFTLPGDKEAWLTPITGSGTADDVAWKAGECVALHGACRIQGSDDADILIAYPGTERLSVS